MAYFSGGGSLAAHAKKKYFPCNSGIGRYDFTPIDTVALQVCESALQNNVDGIINICSGTSTPLKEMLQLYKEHYSLNIEIEFGKFPERAYDSPLLYGDSAPILRILGGH